MGYGYVGRWSGPFALLDPQDFPAVLAHAENELAGKFETFTLMIPMHNRAALLYALDRKFRFDDTFMMLFMANHTPPGLDRYVSSMPGFFT